MWVGWDTEAKDLSSNSNCSVTQWTVLSKTVLSVGLGFLVYKMTGQERRVSKILYCRRDTEVEINLCPLIQQQNSEQILNKAQNCCDPFCRVPCSRAGPLSVTCSATLWKLTRAGMASLGLLREVLLPGGSGIGGVGEGQGQDWDDSRICPTRVFLFVPNRKSMVSETVG